MIKFFNLASEIRLSSLVCSSVAVLLTACGGGADQAATPSAQLDQASSNLAMVSRVAAPGNPDSAPAQADSSTSAPVQADSTTKVASSPAEFAVTGYAADAPEQQQVPAPAPAWRQ